MATVVSAFLDGENLVCRYESMLKAGRIPRADVVHIPGLLVWHPNMTKQFLCRFQRINFYQTVVGAVDEVDAAREKVADVRYRYSEGNVGGGGSLYPRLFKKQARGSKTKSVDINICVDLLRCVFSKNSEVVMLASGDGDYLPLVNEINRQGVQVWLFAFSDGLSRDLRFAADDFIDLDEIFFQPLPPNDA